jgi:hypothetical protein
MLLHTKVSFLLVLVTAEVLLTGTHEHDDHPSSTAKYWWQKSRAFLLRSNVQSTRWLATGFRMRTQRDFTAFLLWHEMGSRRTCTCCYEAHRLQRIHEPKQFWRSVLSAHCEYVSSETLAPHLLCLKALQAFGRLLSIPVVLCLASAAAHFQLILTFYFDLTLDLSRAHLAEASTVDLVSSRFLTSKRWVHDHASSHSTGAQSGAWIRCRPSQMPSSAS